MELECKEKPEVSVVINAYNVGKYIHKAIMSVLNQTFSDFELIIVNDASTDNTLDIIKMIKDPRIVVISNKKNRGVSYSLNQGFRIAKGKYIAHMDADDISLPKRIEKQYDYMEKHPDIAICGCNYKCFERDNRVVVSPEESSRIKVNLLFSSPLGHSTWFIRKKIFEDLKIKYDERFRTSQDYELMYRIKDKCKLACLQEVLVLYRVRRESLSRNINGLDKNTLKIQKNILKELHIRVTVNKLKLLNDVYSITNVGTYIRFVLLSIEIIIHNKIFKVFNQRELETKLRDIWCASKELIIGSR